MSRARVSGRMDVYNVQKLDTSKFRGRTYEYVQIFLRLA